MPEHRPNPHQFLRDILTVCERHQLCLTQDTGGALVVVPWDPRLGSLLWQTNIHPALRLPEERK